MKYGIRNRSLNMEWKDALTTAGEIGYDGVELMASGEVEETIAMKRKLCIVSLTNPLLSV